MRTMIKTVATATVLLASSAISVGSIAAESAKSVVGAPSTNRWTQALIDRIDTDKSGKVSKAEFMKFMEAEWDALDTNKSGTLETTEYENREYFKREIQR